jgi:UDP-N-acetylglucosamine 2-epimerase
MKIVTIIGARPQFIKAAAVSRAIMAHNERCPDTQICEVIVHTGQHYDANMSQVFFDELQIPPPDYNLGVGSGSHGAMTGSMLAKIEEVLLGEHPDFVIVYGDTNSTLAGALAAVKMQIPAVHVEAGLRSFNRRMPEEINRVIADQTANVLFCPTRVAVDNLEKEGVGISSGDLENQSFDFNTQQVYQVGDVMYDSILFNGQLAEQKSIALDQLGLLGKPYALATLHRAENTDDPLRLRRIFQAFCEIAENHIPLVLPLHPRTRKFITQAGFTFSPPGLRIIEPVGYLDMLCLERNARVILTDSGGVQKEAFFMGVPCITLRDETEWTETVERGWNSLAGADTAKIVKDFSRATQIVSGLTPFGVSKNVSATFEYPYGDGRAAEKVVGILANLQAPTSEGSVRRND